MKYSFRITPLHSSVVKESNPIDSDYLTKLLEKPRITKFILSRESTPTLHYHGVVYTDYKVCGLRNLLRKITTYDGKGNGFFSLKKCPIDDYAENYVCKEGDIVAQKGFKDNVIKEYVIKGKEYLEEKEFRKQKLKDIIGKYLDSPSLMEGVRNSKYVREEWVKTEPSGDVSFDSIFLPLILYVCEKYGKSPPARHIYRNYFNYYAFKYAPLSFLRYYEDHVGATYNHMYIESSEVNKIPFTKDLIYEELKEIEEI